MTDSLKCSVIIPTYNRSSLLMLTLDALKQQRLDCNCFEVLVVDDGSSDDTKDVITRFESYLNIRYFYQEDRGFRVAKARNKGIIEARSDLCIMIDSGILPGSECLQAHYDLHLSSASPTAVCGYVYAFDEGRDNDESSKVIIDNNTVDAAIELLDRGGYFDPREEFYFKYGDEFDYLPAPWVVYWAGNASAPKNLLLTSGLFDEAFTAWGGEDIELGYRMHQHGCRFALSRAARALHYPHKKQYRKNMEDSKIGYTYFANKYQTPITALIPNTHLWLINDIILRYKLPKCQDYLRTHKL